MVSASRSDSRHSAIWPGAWPGMWTTRKPATSSPSSTVSAIFTGPAVPEAAVQERVDLARPATAGRAARGPSSASRRRPRRRRPRRGGRRRHVEAGRGRRGGRCGRGRARSASGRRAAPPRPRDRLVIVRDAGVEHQHAVAVAHEVDVAALRGLPREPPDAVGDLGRTACRAASAPRACVALNSAVIRCSAAESCGGQQRRAGGRSSCRRGRRRCATIRPSRIANVVAALELDPRAGRLDAVPRPGPGERAAQRQRHRAALALGRRLRRTSNAHVGERGEQLRDELTHAVGRDVRCAARGCSRGALRPSSRASHRRHAR